jgi:hypothetical protein
MAGFCEYWWVLAGKQMGFLALWTTLKWPRNSVKNYVSKLNWASLRRLSRRETPVVTWDCSQLMTFVLRLCGEAIPAFLSVHQSRRITMYDIRVHYFETRCSIQFRGIKCRRVQDQSFSCVIINKYQYSSQTDWLTGSYEPLQDTVYSEL